MPLSGNWFGALHLKKCFILKDRRRSEAGIEIEGDLPVSVNLFNITWKQNNVGLHMQFCLRNLPVLKPIVKCMQLPTLT